GGARLRGAAGERDAAVVEGILFWSTAALAPAVLVVEHGVFVRTAGVGRVLVSNLGRHASPPGRRPGAAQPGGHVPVLRHRLRTLLHPAEVLSRRRQLGPRTAK